MRTKKILIILVGVGVLIASSTYWLDYVGEGRDIISTDCQEDAVHDIYGAEYIMRGCLLAPSPWDSESTLVRLSVYSKDRALLAERYFTKYWRFRGYGLAEDGKSVYHVTSSPSKEGHIQLPPTPLDWLRARLP